MTQCDKIIRYLKEHGSISPREAMNEFNCYRLAARISDLRRLGFKILTASEKTKEGSIYARYYLT